MRGGGNAIRLFFFVMIWQGSEAFIQRVTASITTVRLATRNSLVTCICQVFSVHKNEYKMSQAAWTISKSNTVNTQDMLNPPALTLKNKSS